MPFHRKCMLALCLALVLLIPLSMLLFSVLDREDGRMADFATYDYLALTDPTGGEFVYRPTDPLFATVAAAFACAPATDAAPSAFSEASLILDWIKDDRADRYTLAYAPDLLSVRLTDREDNAYLLSGDAAIALLATDAGKSSLVGENPPALTVGDKTVSPAILEWKGEFAYQSGERVTLSSGEYRTATPLCPLPTAAPVFSFAEAPSVSEYSVFAGGTLVAAGNTLPSLTSLPAGEYQLVLVAEWQNGNRSVRAGYSFSFCTV